MTFLRPQFPGLVPLGSDLKPPWANPRCVPTGLFRVFCSTLHHFARGMNQLYEVGSCGHREPHEQPYGMIRTFYIAAEEVEWDYAPNKNWEFEKQHLDAGGERYHGPSHCRSGGGGGDTPLATRWAAASAQRREGPVS